MFGGVIVDLTQEIYQGMPVYPGHLKTVVWTHLSHEECQRQLGTDFSYETRGTSRHRNTPQRRCLASTMKRSMPSGWGIPKRMSPG